MIHWHEWLALLGCVLGMVGLYLLVMVLIRHWPDGRS